MKIYVLTMSVVVKNLESGQSFSPLMDNYIGAFTNLNEIRTYLKGFTNFLIDDTKKNQFVMENLLFEDEEEAKLAGQIGVILHLSGYKIITDEMKEQMPEDTIQQVKETREEQIFKISVRDTDDKDYVKKKAIFIKGYDPDLKNIMTTENKYKDEYNEIREFCKTLQVS